MTKFLTVLAFGIFSFSALAVTPDNFSEDVNEFRAALAAKERVLIDFSAHW